MSKLIITENERDKIYEIVDESFVIGSGPKADLQLRAEAASEVHLTVKKGKTGYRLIDMETKSGTLVNGKPVNEHVLSNGDTIQIGDAKITFIGKGPARAAAAAARAKGPKLESRYRNSSRKQGLGVGGSLALLFGIVAFLGVIFWFMLSSEAPKDTTMLAIKDAINDLEEGRENADSIRVRIDKLAKGELQAEHKTKLAELRKMAQERSQVVETKALEEDAKALWVQIHNKRLHAPDDIGGLKALTDEYLQKFSGADPPTRHEAEVRDLVAELNNEGMSPERAKLGKLQATVRELFAAKEYRLAWEAVQSADSALKGLYQEELEAMSTRLRKRSRQVLGVRKNDVRDELRNGRLDSARKLTEALCDKLVFSTMEDYLQAPDKGYSNQDTARLELETQKLMREVMDEWKRTHGG